MHDDELTLVGLILGLLIGMATAAFIVNGNWQDETITRGLSEYCPLTGSWSWKGECDK